MRLTVILTLLNLDMTETLSPNSLLSYPFILRSKSYGPPLIILYIKDTPSSFRSSVMTTHLTAEQLAMLDVLDAIRDPDGRDLFNFIATDRKSNDSFDYTVKITRKQYYSRLSKLVKADLIKRKGGKYVLTPFGDVIYSVQLGFADAVEEHLKSKVEVPIIIN